MPGPPGWADGHCTPYLQDSTQLADDTRLSQQQEGTTYSLVLRDVAQQDAGVYTCLARNAGGQVLCKAELLVHGGKSGTPPRPCLSSTRAWGSHGPQGHRHRQLPPRTLELGIEVPGGHTRLCCRLPPS